MSAEPLPSNDAHSTDVPSPDATAPVSENPVEGLESAKQPPEPPEPALGWTAYAEQINGRFAMLGFFLLLALEFFTHQDLFTWLGLR